MASVIQSAAEGSIRAVEELCDLFLVAAFQIAEHDGRPAGSRQAGDLFVDDPDLFKACSVLRGVICIVRRLRACHGGLSRLVFEPASGPGLESACRAMGRAVEPVAQQFGAPDCAGLRARTRNVAWKASSASLASGSSDRHVRRTIGPCRDTRAAKAASASSARRLANRSSNWPSVNPAAVPAPNNVRNRSSIRPCAPGCILSPRWGQYLLHPDCTARPGCSPDNNFEMGAERQGGRCLALAQMRQSVTGRAH